MSGLVSHIQSDGSTQTLCGKPRKSVTEHQIRWWHRWFCGACTRALLRYVNDGS